MTDLREPLSDRLRTLDPAPRRAMTDAEVRCSDELLLRLIERERAPLAREKGRRSLRPALGVMAILSAAALAAVLVLSVGSSPNVPVSNFALSAEGALSSYTATPVPVAPSTADRNACGTASSEHGNTSEEAVLTSEQRGDFRALMFADEGDQAAYCIVTGDVALWISNSEFLRTAPPEDLQLEAPPAQDAITTDMGRMDSPSDDFGIVTSLSGRSGADVTGVRLALPDGRIITAAVGEGHWSAWWPSTLADPGVALPDFPSATTFTTVDGAEHTAPRTVVG